MDNKQKNLRTDILGVKVSAITYHQTLSSVKRWIDKNQRKYICVSNVHSIMECQKNPVLLKGVNGADIVTPDGMPLVWLSNYYGRKTERIYGPTLTDKLCLLSEKNNYKVLFLGSTKDRLKDLSSKIITLYPKLKVAGYIETPIRPIPESLNGKIIRKINRSKVKIVFVGMGCPYQECWIIQNREKLNANILIGVGAAFDFISGRVKQAPVWVQEIGFEWLFRLTQDPKRLWQRYTITNISFVYRISAQLFRHFILKR